MKLSPLDAVPAFRKAAVLSANAEHEQAMDGCSCGKAGTAGCGARVPESRQAWPPRTDKPLAVSTAPTDIRASPSHRGGSTTFRSGMPCHPIA